MVAERWSDHGPNLLAIRTFKKPKDVNHTLHVFVTKTQTREKDEFSQKKWRVRLVSCFLARLHRSGARTLSEEKVAKPTEHTVSTRNQDDGPPSVLASLGEVIQKEKEKHI